MVRQDGQEGQNPTNDVGISGVLNANQWNGLSLPQPTEFHRAHGFAKKFGGAGVPGNIGLWPIAQENEWSLLEEHIEGGNFSNQIPDWKPAETEKGNLEVTRIDYPIVNLKNGYLEGLRNGGIWGFDINRPAWVRALNRANPVTYPVESLNIAKARLALNLNNRLGQLIPALFGQADSNLIQSMTIQYNRTEVGLNAGPLRNNINETKNAPAINPALFGLINDVESIWSFLITRPNDSILNNNIAKNVFETQLQNLIVRVPNVTEGEPPLELSPQADGWGL